MIDGIKKAFDYIKANDSYIENAISKQNALWRGEKSDMPTLALTCWLTEEQDSWLTGYNTKEIHFDSEKMLINGLRGVLTAVNGNYGAVPSMRANMGCGIISSLFGAQQRLFEDKMPWLADHLKKEDILNKLSKVDKDKYDFNINDSAEFAAAMTHMEYMAENLRNHNLKNIFISPLDLQGPIDTAHLIYGDALFYDLYDDPDFTHHLLDVSCGAIEFAIQECFDRIDRSGEFIAYSNHLIMPKDSGGLIVCEDTTTLLSLHLIDEFARPYLRRVFQKFGGGCVHYCGKNAHLLEVLFDEPLVKGINFGNPEMHDMTKVIEKCRDTRKVYIGGIGRKDGESLFDYFTRVLEPSYDRNTGCFYIIPSYDCNLDERGNVIGEFEYAVENIIKT